MKNWTAMPNIFPHGIEEVAVKTGWPIVAHNRYWSGDTDYATQVSSGERSLIVICMYTGLSLYVCTQGCHCMYVHRAVTVCTQGCHCMYVHRAVTACMYTGLSLHVHRAVTACTQGCHCMYTGLSLHVHRAVTACMYTGLSLHVCTQGCHCMYVHRYVCLYSSCPGFYAYSEIQGVIRSLSQWPHHPQAILTCVTHYFKSKIHAFVLNRDISNSYSTHTANSVQCIKLWIICR